MKRERNDERHTHTHTHTHSHTLSHTHTHTHTLSHTHTHTHTGPAAHVIVVSESNSENDLLDNKRTNDPVPSITADTSCSSSPLIILDHVVS